MPIFGTRGLFTVSRTAPVILSQTVNQGDTLVYQASQGVFTNQPGVGIGPNGGGLVNLANVGSGVSLSTLDNNLISIKALAAGANVILTDDGQTITINSTATGTTGVAVSYTVLDYTSGTTDLISLPAGAIILSTEVAVMTAFNGTPTLTLGPISDPTMLMDSTGIDLTEMSNTFKNDISFVIPGTGNQDIKSFFVANGATQGQFSIFIEYALQ